jgi:endoglucanase Acf2
MGYASPRGRMKLLPAKDFTTKLRFNGVLPVLPHVAKDDSGRLRRLVSDAAQKDELFPKGLGEKPDNDAYWEGKSFGRLANLLELAHQLELPAERARLLTSLQNRLADWFDGHAPRYFYYDSTWRTLVGFPDSYGSASHINDHHFHYGYFVWAAAVVARHDPGWARTWGPLVEMLIRDAANWDRAESRFPFLRYMDVYAGHSWANGPAQFEEGNNQEASSEDINFSAAVMLWGAVTDNRPLRDLGIFLYANQVVAVEQYWFDVDDAVFPKRFDHPTVAMVWGAGAKYDTWFAQDPILIHGINFLPFTGASLYLGRRPDYVKKNFDVLLARSYGQITTWRDYILMFAALGDAERAWEYFERDRLFEPEFGNSMAMTEHWLTNLKALGRLDSTITADSPFFAVFANKGRRSHVAFNPSASPTKVKFSDGTVVDVPSRGLVVR